MVAVASYPKTKRTLASVQRSNAVVRNPSRRRPASRCSGTKPVGTRGDDPAYLRDNGSPKHVSLTLETFAGAHDQNELEENDRLLTHRWHGHHGDGESWADRDVWAGAASADAQLIASLAGYQEQPDLRFDAKLLRFAFTQTYNSNQPVAFCVEGDRRIATILTMFGPHFGQAERRFELVFR